MLHHIASRKTAFAAAVAAALTLGTAAQADTLPSVVAIPYDAGSHGHPFTAAPINLSTYGYVENEFQISGVTNAYRPANLWTKDGKWSVAVSQSDLPYTTRMLVRRPADPTRFNGTVVVEWLNVATGQDTEPSWAGARDELLRDGFAWVGVSAQTRGLEALKSWDPDRYGGLSESTDAQSYDIFTQAAQVLRAHADVLLGGLPVSKLIATGDSQSASRLATYVNAFQQTTLVYDGFVIRGRSPTAAPIADGKKSVLFLGAFLRDDGATPVMQLISEAEVLAFFGLARQPDNTYLRTWEVPGTPHIDYYEGTYGQAELNRDLGIPRINCALPVNKIPYHYAEEAAWFAVNRWINGGAAPASAAPIETNLLGGIKRDAYGNAKGGVRLPDLTVPYARYGANDNKAAPGGTDRDNAYCPLVGTTTVLDGNTLLQLYPTHQSYVDEVTTAADAAVQAGFLLPQERDQEVSDAQAAAIPQ